MYSRNKKFGDAEVLSIGVYFSPTKPEWIILVYCIPDCIIFKRHSSKFERTYFERVLY